jgi:hypothetical protein
MTTTHPFITIDDLHRLAQKLADGLGRLGEYKHPLAVRKGRKEVKTMAESKDSKQVKGAGRTYFFDVDKTREGKRYLKITESRKGKEGKWRRNTINVFPEDAGEFEDVVTEMTSKL